MSVHYKFKSALDFDTITFDGLHISVDDLKKAIVHQKRLGKTADFDLQITNAQTKEEYTDDLMLIPKNTSLIIARIPLARQPKKTWDPSADKPQARIQNESDSSKNPDLSRMNGSEEDKINAMMIQSTMDYDPNNYQKIRGGGQTGEVPASYRCYKCHKTGHWIKNCPMNAINENADVKRNTGIPRSFIDAQNDPSTIQPVPVVIMEKKQEIPEDLICSICKDLFTDAVMIPCCGSSFCDECVRTALLESEDNECPDCSEKGSSPGSLIPNRFLRNSVNSFKNETGYSKPRPAQKPAAPPVQQPKEPVEEAATTPVQPENTIAVDESREAVVDEGESEPIQEEVVQKTDEQRPDTPHEESDYEDNITVTVPPAHLQSGNAFRDHHLNGRPTHRHLMPPGLDTPPNHPHHHHQHHNQHAHEDRSATPTIDEKESYSAAIEHSKHQSDERHTHNAYAHHMHPNERQPQPMPQEQYHQQPINSYGHSNQLPQQRPYDAYGHPQQNYAPRPYDPHAMHRPQFQHRGGYHGGGPPMQHQMRPRHINPVPGSVASVFQGVAEKIGTGIIDDPLEAFNRIMREKERRKEERRNSPPPRRRSRSIERDPIRRRSPLLDRRRSPRLRSPENRRGRSPHDRIRPRSIERRSEERRRKRSVSYETRMSRSYSRSRSRSIRRVSRSPPPMQRKRSRSPPMRRSRSRSPSFSISRSRSRSHSPGYYRAPLHSRHNIRSPPQLRGSPRNRFRDSRRGDRRDDYHSKDREDYRDRSPGYNANYGHRGSRGSYRGRGRGSYSSRHDRPSMPLHHQQQPPPQSHQSHLHQVPTDQYYQQGQNQSGYHDGNQYIMPSNNRYITPRSHSPTGGTGLQQVSTRVTGYAPQQALPPSAVDTLRYDEDPMAYGRARYDEMPPGTEPPPPGFENAPLERFSREREWKKNNEAPDAHEFRHTPDQSGLSSHDHDRRLTPEPRAVSRSHRTTSREPRSSDMAGGVEKRRRVSKTPSYRESRKEKESSRDRQKEVDKHEKDKRDHERSSRREHGSVRDKHHRDVEKKDNHHHHHHEKEKHREKEREREHREKDKEKEKKRDSSEDDKREKKAKEKKKKKKEEKALEKKKKKERKEKEKRDKELRKEQDKARKLLEAKIEHHIDEEGNTVNTDEHDDEEAAVGSSDDRKHTPPPSERPLHHHHHHHHHHKTQEASSETQEKHTPEQSISESKGVGEYEEDDDEEENGVQDESKVSNSAQDEIIFNDSGNTLNEEEDISTTGIHSDTPPNATIDRDEHTLDLYGDIVDTNLAIDYPHNETKTSKKEHLINSSLSPRTLNRSDSILDIHANLDFEHEMDDMEPEVSSNKIKQNSNSSYHPFPEPSKWERDEEMLSSTGEKVSGSDTSPYDDKNESGVGGGGGGGGSSSGGTTGSANNKVTNEVLKRAENAIFARAINAIRPIEIKKISVERQKLYANDKNQRELSPAMQMLITKSTAAAPGSLSPPPTEMQTFQITVPVNSNDITLERSVEIKSDSLTKSERARTKTPIRSVKERLGSKITEFRRSRTRTPPRKVHIEKSNRNSRQRDSKTKENTRSKETEKISSSSSRSDARDARRTNESRNNGGSSTISGDKEKDKRDVRTDGASNSRNRDRDRSRERRKSPISSNRDRERERARELARNREKERAREISRKDSDGKEKKESKRDGSPVDDKHRRDKRYKKDEKRKDEDNKSEVRPKSDTSKNISNSKTSTTSTLERKKSMIDEANFEPDYDEHVVEHKNDNTRSKKRDDSKSAKPKDDSSIAAKPSSLSVPSAKRSEAKKRSRSASSSSSSSGSSSDDSSSESEDKKRKKRKHKKQKRSKRASSSDSDGSTKKKKNKKKKSKKKKKTKK